MTGDCRRANQRTADPGRRSEITGQAHPPAAGLRRGTALLKALCGNLKPSFRGFRGCRIRAVRGSLAGSLCGGHDGSERRDDSGSRWRCVQDRRSVVAIDRELKDRCPSVQGHGIVDSRRVVAERKVAADLSASRVGRGKDQSAVVSRPGDIIESNCRTTRFGDQSVGERANHALVRPRAWLTVARRMMSTCTNHGGAGGLLQITLLPLGTPGGRPPKPM